MPEEDLACDVLVIGTGAGGAAAAVTAKLKGLDVILVEKTDVFGGTTVYSGGWLWAPGNPLATEAGITDSIEDARAYIKAESGNHYDAVRVDRFLDAVPRMVGFFQRSTCVNFFVGPFLPDYHTRQAGSRPGYRSICALPINGRALGASLKRFRAPRRELLVFGLTIASGPDMKHFFSAGRSVVSALYVARRLAVSLCDRATHGRDLQFGNGAALAARFFKSVLDNGIPVLFSTPAKRLLTEGGRVTGAVVDRQGEPVEIRARRGVVIATGGFPGDSERRRALFPHHPLPDQHRTLAVQTNTGDGLTLGESAGGVVDRAMLNPAPWMPVSAVPFQDGTTGTFMHLFDRGKPGVIAVSPQGVRFTNEGASYLDFVNDLIRLGEPGQDCFAWLIGDYRAVRRYGLGIAKPAPMPLGRLLRSGYLLKGRTLDDLAAKISVPPSTLRETVERFNRHAARGEDPDFQRGTEAYNNYIGDPDHTPSPALGPLQQAPFYAVKILPGDIGTFAGLKTDADARVLNDRNEPIAGLFAVGSDNANVFGGAYPGGGSTLGPAVTFGFIAGEALAAGL